MSYFDAAALRLQPMELYPNVAYFSDDTVLGEITTS